MSLTATDQQKAFAQRPDTTASLRCAAPMTGAEFLESLRDGREVYIYGERVGDVTAHPAIRPE
jgi:4-hydroxyphenylacetate 3-monooxygenase